VDKIDEPLERGAFLLARRREHRLELSVGVEDSPEVLETALVIPERVSLEVEEEVARRRFGQEREAGLGLRLEDDVAVEARQAGFELELRLFPQLREALGGDSLRHGLRRRGAETGERGDAGCRELVDLTALDVGDAAEVVDRIPARVAERLELADAALLARVRLSGRWIGD